MSIALQLSVRLTLPHREEAGMYIESICVCLRTPEYVHYKILKNVLQLYQLGMEDFLKCYLRRYEDRRPERKNCCVRITPNRRRDWHRRPTWRTEQGQTVLDTLTQAGSMQHASLPV